MYRGPDSQYTSDFDMLHDDLSARFEALSSKLGSLSLPTSGFVSEVGGVTMHGTVEASSLAKHLGRAKQLAFSISTKINDPDALTAFIISELSNFEILLRGRKTMKMVPVDHLVDVANDGSTRVLGQRRFRG